MNMPFTSSSAAKNAYFMSGVAVNEIYIFSLHEMNKRQIYLKKRIFFLLYTILSLTDFFALNYVIHVRTLRHFNDDFA